MYLDIEDTQLSCMVCVWIISKYFVGWYILSISILVTNKNSTQLNSLGCIGDNEKFGFNEFAYSILFSNLMKMYKFETTSFKRDFHCLS